MAYIQKTMVIWRETLARLTKLMREDQLAIRIEASSGLSEDELKLMNEEAEANILTFSPIQPSNHPTFLPFYHPSPMLQAPCPMPHALCPISFAPCLSF